MNGEHASFGHPILLFLGLVLITSSLLLFLQPVPLLAVLPPLLMPLLLFLARRPHYGYYIIICLVPLDAWRGLTEKYPSLTISKLVGAWVLLALLIRFARKPELLNRLRTNLWYPLFGFFLVLTISSLYSDFSPNCIYELRKLITAYLFFALTLFFVKENDLKRNIPLILIGSTSISAFIAVVGKLLQIPSLIMDVNSATIPERAVATANDPNFFAAMILISLPLIAHFFFSTQSMRFKFLLAGLFLQNCFAIVITYSRGVTLVLIVTVVMILMEHIGRVRAKHFGFLLLFAGALGAFGLSRLPGTDIWERMKSLTVPQTDASLLRRGSYILVAWQAFKENPVLGSGPSAFPLIYQHSIYAAAFAKDESDYKRAAHNTYLEIVVGTGMLGLLLFLLALCLAFKYLYAAQSRLRGPERLDGAYVRPLAYSFLSLLLSFLFLSSPYHKYIWLFIGLSAVAYNLSGQMKPNR